MPKLRRYLVYNLDRSQTGFVPGLGTSVNIQLLIDKLRNCKKKDGQCALFIDFKSAYNTIDRNILYRYMHEKNILEQEELNFLQHLHELIHFDLKSGKVRLDKGVHQGSPLSPALFDIYMELFMTQIRAHFPDIWYLLYADDLVLVTSSKQIKPLIDCLYEQSSTYNLVINAKKSAIL